MMQERLISYILSLTPEQTEKVVRHLDQIKMLLAKGGNEE